MCNMHFFLANPTHLYGKVGDLKAILQWCLFISCGSLTLNGDRMDLTLLELPTWVGSWEISKAQLCLQCDLIHPLIIVAKRVFWTMVPKSLHETW